LILTIALGEIKGKMPKLLIILIIIPLCTWLFSIGLLIVTSPSTIIDVLSDTLKNSTGICKQPYCLPRQPLFCLNRGVTVMLSHPT
jgi:hypothetical protein